MYIYSTREKIILLKSVKDNCVMKLPYFVLFIFFSFVSYYFHVNIYVDKKKNLPSGDLLLRWEGAQENKLNCGREYKQASKRS